MEKFAVLLIPALLAIALVWLCVKPIKLAAKLLANSLCGFACLWLLNTIAPFTGILFPINAVTVLIAGFGGLPGIGILALLGVLS